MPPYLYQWIDLAWLPIALIAARPGHRLLAAGFVAMCAVTLHIQAELMDHIGHPSGFSGLIRIGAYSRGLIVYGVITALFLALAWLSPGTLKSVFMGACLAVYFAAFTLSMLVMLV